MTPALMPNEAYANWQYRLVSCHICTMLLRNYGQTAQQKAGCGIESFTWQVSVCVCARTSLWSSLSQGLDPHKHRWSPEAFSSVYCGGGSLFILYSPSLETPIFQKNTIREEGWGAVGRHTEGEARTKSRNRRFKEGKRGKRGEKSPFNSCHCLDVNWSWSRFR